MLAETTAELNLTTVASVASVSEAQASRVLPGLVSVGLVERREVPSSLFRLVREHMAAGPVLALARSRDRMIQEMREIAESLPVRPMSVVIFGSFARGEADAESDVDTLMVRPGGIGQSDEAWSATVQLWIGRVGEASGNPVEVLQVDQDEVMERLDGGRSGWQESKRDDRSSSGRHSIRSRRWPMAEGIKTRAVPVSKRGQPDRAIEKSYRAARSCRR